MSRVVLASASPRRKLLLGALVREFDVVVPDIRRAVDRRRPRRRAPVGGREGRIRLIPAVAPGGVAADTLVHDAIRTYGKPVDAADAVTMLARLRGRTHTVTTAVAVACSGRVESGRKRRRRDVARP